LGLYASEPEVTARSCSKVLQTLLNETAAIDLEDEVRSPAQIEAKRNLLLWKPVRKAGKLLTSEKIW
jgi:hypothetical protein